MTTWIFTTTTKKCFQLGTDNKRAVCFKPFLACPIRAYYIHSGIYRPDHIRSCLFHYFIRLKVNKARTECKQTRPHPATGMYTLEMFLIAEVVTRMAVILKLVIFLNTVRPFNSISLLLNYLLISYQENIREYYFNSVTVKEDLELKEF